MLKTYEGGLVPFRPRAFRIESLDLEKNRPVGECNCSICTRRAFCTRRYAGTSSRSSAGWTI